MWRIFGGAPLVIAGIAAFIEAHSHRPVPEPRYGVEPEGLSQTAYDLIRIGGWALVIIGGLMVITGLIGYWMAQRRREPG